MASQELVVSSEWSDFAVQHLWKSRTFWHQTQIGLIEKPSLSRENREKTGKNHEWSHCRVGVTN